MKTSTLIATTLAIALSASSAMADGQQQGKNNSSHGDCSQGSGMYHSKDGGKRGHDGSDCAMSWQKDRSYSANEIKTLMEARLIRKGNPNIKVGKVTATDTGYKVTIVTKDNSLVEELDLSKSGASDDDCTRHAG